MSLPQRRSRRRGALVMLVFVVMLPAAGFAQSWDLAAMAGVGIPAGDLSDFTESGFSASISATRWMTPRWGVRLGGAGDFLGGNKPFPSVNMWHYNVGAEVDLLPNKNNFKWLANGGIGGNTAQYEGGGENTDFALNFGTTLEYPINPYFRLIGGPSLYVIFSERTGYVLPITAGFRYLFSTP